MGDADDGQDWEVYLLAISQEILSKKPPTYCLQGYYEYLDFGLEALREVLMDLHCCLPQRYALYIPMVRAACDVLTSLRLQPLGVCDNERFKRVKTAFRARNPTCDRSFGPLMLPTIQSDGNPQKYTQRVSDELEFLSGLQLQVKAPGHVNWALLHSLWKQLACVSRHLDLCSMD